MGSVTGYFLRYSRQLFTEFVQFLLPEVLISFSFRHFRSDFTNSSVQTSSDDNTTSLASSLTVVPPFHLLVLVHSPWVRNGLVVLDYRDRLTSPEWIDQFEV
jgi:hypothetical protein